MVSASLVALPPSVHPFLHPLCDARERERDGLGGGMKEVDFLGREKS